MTDRDARGQWAPGNSASMKTGSRTRRHGLALVVLGSKYRALDKRLRRIRASLEECFQGRTGADALESDMLIDQLLCCEMTARILLRRVGDEGDKLSAVELTGLMTRAAWAKVQRDAAFRRLRDLGRGGDAAPYDPLAAVDWSGFGGTGFDLPRGGTGGAASTPEREEGR